MSHLLWTADACLLMTILGWVTIIAAALTAFYLWYICICFWQQLRVESEDARRVTRAIAALPTRRYRLPPAADDSGGGGEPDGDSCAICLDTFSDGEEVRMLPCMHEFCKPCIDQWIQRSGLTAACPLCKRLLLPSAPAVNARAPPSVAAAATAATATATTLSAAADAIEPDAAEDVERGEGASTMQSGSYQHPVAPQAAQAELAAEADECACEVEGGACAGETSAGSAGGSAPNETTSVVVQEEGESARPEHLCSPIGSNRPQAALE